MANTKLLQDIFIIFFKSVFGISFCFLISFSNSFISNLFSISSSIDVIFNFLLYSSFSNSLSSSSNIPFIVSGFLVVAFLVVAFVAVFLAESLLIFIVPDFSLAPFATSSDNFFFTPATLLLAVVLVVAFFVLVDVVVLPVFFALADVRALSFLQ